MLREVYRRDSIAIISKKWHFSSSHIYGCFTEAIFTNIKDRDELFEYHRSVITKLVKTDKKWQIMVFRRFSTCSPMNFIISNHPKI